MALTEPIRRIAGLTEGEYKLEERNMPEDKANKFASFSDFKAKLSSMFEGPTFYATFNNLDEKLRKKIMITISIVNNCKE